MSVKTLFLGMLDGCHKLELALNKGNTKSVVKFGYILDSTWIIRRNQTFHS